MCTGVNFDKLNRSLTLPSLGIEPATGPCCLTSTEARLLIRDGGGGGGGGGKRARDWRDRGPPPEQWKC